MVDYAGAAVFAIKGEQGEILDYSGPLPPEKYLDLGRRYEKTGVFAELARTRAPLIIDDVHGDSPLARNIQKVFGDELYTMFKHLRSWMGIPLIVKDQVVGMITCTYPEPNHFTSRHARLALAIGNQAAVAIENA